MIIGKRIIAVAVLFLLAVPLSAAETETIELGGLRKVTAVISQKDDGWNIAVSMLPVRCFTPLVNQRISRQYALKYALVALAKKQQIASLSVKNHSLITESDNNNFYTGLFYITGVSPVSEKSEPSSPRRISHNHVKRASIIAISLNTEKEDLFSREDDWKQIITSWGNILINEMFSLAENHNEDEFLLDIEAMETGMISGCKLLKDNIENDKLLLVHEKSELLQSLRIQETKIKRHLAALYNQLEITEPKFKKEFIPYVCSDPIILNQGGTRIYKLNDKQFVLFSVGLGTAKNNTVQERINQKNMAKVKAMSNLLKLNGVQITAFEKFSEKVKISHTADGIEQYETSAIFLQKIREFAEGHARSLPTIGTWYSKDKKFFFTAIGAFVNYE